MMNFCSRLPCHAELRELEKLCSSRSDNISRCLSKAQWLSMELSKPLPCHLLTECSGSAQLPLSEGRHKLSKYPAANAPPRPCQPASLPITMKSALSTNADTDTRVTARLRPQVS